MNVTEDETMIAILDYDAGNIKSVEKAVHYLGEEAEDMYYELWKKVK